MWKMKVRIICALLFSIFLSYSFITINHYAFNYKFKLIGDIFLVCMVYIFIPIVVLIISSILNFQPTQAWINKKRANCLIHYCKEIPPKEDGFFILASEETEETWFHLSQKNNDRESRLLSFFRNHCHWLELESYKIVVPISEVDIKKIFIRIPELSIYVVGPLKIRAEVENDFDWHNNHLHLVAACMFYYIYVFNIRVNLRFLFGVWKPNNRKN